MNDFVYFVECDPNIEPDTNLLKFVKVGKSSSLLGIKKRIVNFGVGNPFKLTFLGYIIGNETELHNRFIKYKRKGEWFFLTKEFQKEINSLNLIKENCNDVSSSFYNDFIIDEYVSIKKDTIRNKLKQETKNNLFKKAQERKDKKLSLDFSSIEVFVSGLFNNNKDYSYNFISSNKDNKFDFFNLPIPYHSVYLRIKKQNDNELIELSLESLENLFKLFKIFYHNDWNYNHHLIERINADKKEQWLKDCNVIAKKLDLLNERINN